MNSSRPVSGPVLWDPGEARRSASHLGRWLAQCGFGSYEQMWEWSVAPATAGDFWQAVAGYFGVQWRSPPACALVPGTGRPPGYRWFPGGRLNYAEHMLRAPGHAGDDLAVMARSQTRPGHDLTWDELRALVARAACGLAAVGVRPGDSVVAYLPNIPEALVAMLACASLGAVWASCPPEMGVAGVLDRFAQLGPAVLLAVDGYRYGKHTVARADEAEAVRRALPSLRAAVWVPYLGADGRVPEGWAGWEEFTAGTGPLTYEPVEFDHPLYVLFSSGTTGKPKAIVHGHGGILLEHAKVLRFHFDLGEGDRFFWYSTTGWMMWNLSVSALLTGAAVVLYDGSPAGEGDEGLWQLVASTRTTCAGVGAGYLVACMRSGAVPSARHDLSALKALGSTGSPLPAAAAEWAYRAVSEDFMLGSFSGGTDVCTGFAGPSPLHPVRAGEISCRCLGARLEVFDDEGRSVVGEEGELVLTGPLPSMPVRFWGDDGSRYRAAYYDRWPGVWAHGDRALLTEHGSLIITGRSDGTLNRGGVRMGTAEFYSVVEALPEVADSLVVHLDDPEGGPGELWLFLVAGPAGGAPDGGALDGRAPDEGAPDEEALAQAVLAALRRDLSVRHLPDRVVVVPAIPRTLSGKKLEVPVKRLLSGVAPGEAVTLTSVADPASLEPFLRLSHERATARAGAPGKDQER